VKRVAEECSNLSLGSRQKTLHNADEIIDGNDPTIKEVIVVFVVLVLLLM